MRLIDADAFDDVLIHGELKARKARKYVLESAINTIRGNLAKMPTIEECKTGRWIDGSIPTAQTAGVLTEVMRVRLIDADAGSVGWR